MSPHAAWLLPQLHAASGLTVAPTFLVLQDKNRKLRPLYDIPYMFEAREFLRKKLIGKKVRGGGRAWGCVAGSRLRRGARAVDGGTGL